MSKNNFEFSREVRFDSIDRKGWQDNIDASVEECAAVANRLNCNKIKFLRADINLLKKKGGLVYHVTGKLTAYVIQNSIISGDPVPAHIETEIDAWYSDQGRIASFDQAKRQSDAADDHEILSEEDDPEPLYDGYIDVGETAVQFLALALDDYPRTEAEKEGAGDYIEVKPEDVKPNPFAKLAALKKD